MAHPLYWPEKYYSYPFGNTSAVCLTRDLPRDQPANIIIFGCGDPRNILFTFFMDSTTSLAGRQLDFTCVDFDPAILSRNILLLSMIVDGKPYSTTVWDTFFDMYLNERTHVALVEQCRKLIAASHDQASWNASIYGRYIKMGTRFTLLEVRRHWKLYAEMHELPINRLKSIKDRFTRQTKDVYEKWGNNSCSASRSAGPLMTFATLLSQQSHTRYWQNGTLSDPSERTFINPTLVYSFAGEGCHIQYGLDPLATFPFAHHVAAMDDSLSVDEILKKVKSDFRSWCTSTKVALASGRNLIRFICGEATVVSQKLQDRHYSPSPSRHSSVSQWRSFPLELDSEEYAAGRAPVVFDVVDTSNLIDDLGPLNVLLIAVPLLSPSNPPSVLYTESLLYSGKDATKELTQSLFSDFGTLALLLGVCPVDYLSGYAARSYTHEIPAHRTLQGLKGVTSRQLQYQQHTTWKFACSGDSLSYCSDQPPVFQSHQLAILLFDIYHELFQYEDLATYMQAVQKDDGRVMATASRIHVTRETFTVFLNIVRRRLRISSEHWAEVMSKFLACRKADGALDGFRYHDLYTHLHRYGVYSLSDYHQNIPKIGRLAHWDSVPLFVRIFLLVPRTSLSLLRRDEIGGTAPLLHCSVTGESTLSRETFSAVTACFGKLVVSGSKARPVVSIEEDIEGWRGSSPPDSFLRGAIDSSFWKRRSGWS